MEQNVVKKNGIIPVLIVIGIVLIVLSAVLGWYVGSNNSNDCSLEKEGEKVGEKSTYNVLLFDENNELYSDITLKDVNSIENFISATDILTDFELRTVFLESDDIFTNKFKLAYVFSRFVGDAGGIYYFSTEFLDKEIKKVFSTGIDYYDSLAGDFYLFASEMNYVCDEKLCVLDIITGGGAGIPIYHTGIVTTRKDGDKTIYTLKEYYSDFDTGIFVSDGGELLCKNNNCPEDIIATYSDKLNTYEMTFDKDNRYVSSKKVK